MTERSCPTIDLGVSLDDETGEYTVKCRWYHTDYCEVSTGIGLTLAEALRDLAHELDGDPVTELTELRDGFAQTALDGLLSNRHPWPSPYQAALEAYEYADAMLVRRKGYQA